MTTKQDPYASEEETKALLVPDTRTDAERKLDQMMTERGADQQGAEPSLILRQIALELLDSAPPAYPCEVIQADFGDNTVTLQMMNSNFKVSSGLYHLSKAPVTNPPSPKNHGDI